MYSCRCAKAKNMHVIRMPKMGVEWRVSSAARAHTEHFVGRWVFVVGDARHADFLLGVCRLQRLRRLERHLLSAALTQLLEMRCERVRLVTCERTEAHAQMLRTRTTSLCALRRSLARSVGVNNSIDSIEELISNQTPAIANSHRIAVADVGQSTGQLHVLVRVIEHLPLIVS